MSDGGLDPVALAEDLSNKDVVKSGWLTKKGGMRPTWNRRFFRLKDRYLMYFKTEEDLTPTGRIQLNQITLSEAEGKTNQACCFELSTEGRECVVSGEGIARVCEATG